MPQTKKPRKPRTKPVLSLTEAAEYIGLDPDELMLSRYRGLPPGNLGFKDAGRLVWRRSDLAVRWEADHQAAETFETSGGEDGAADNV